MTNAMANIPVGIEVCDDQSAFRFVHPGTQHVWILGCFQDGGLNVVREDNEDGCGFDDEYSDAWDAHYAWADRSNICFLHQVVEFPGSPIESVKPSLVSLEEHNKTAWQRHTAFQPPKPRPNGIACPECGQEMVDTNPNCTLLSNPPQKHVHCEKCEYRGYRIA